MIPPIPPGHPTANSTRLRVGARGSDLSLAQTRWTMSRLQAAHPGLTLELVVIQTHGDRDQITSLAEIGTTGGFVKEIERALLAGEIDLAVHSLKDVPTEPVAGLVIAAIPERAPANDVLVTREARELETLPTGFHIGSSSPRRTHQILAVAPQVRVSPIRGNVPTRLAKMTSGEFDGVLLAAAGLERLGIRPAHAIALDLARFPGAPGQGALAVQTRAEGPVGGIVSAIDHAPTRAAVTAERAFLRAIGGGCHAAAGAHATVLEERLTVVAQLFHGATPVTGSILGRVDESEEVGAKLAKQLREQTAC